MPDKRWVINVNTLEIHRSLTECANKYNTTIPNIHRRINRRDEIVCHYPKTKNSDLAYYDEWVEFADWEKKQLCTWSNIDFFSLTG